MNVPICLGRAVVGCFLFDTFICARLEANDVLNRTACVSLDAARVL